MRQSLPTPALSAAALHSSKHPRYRFGSTSLVTLVAVAALMFATGHQILPEAQVAADMTEQDVVAKEVPETETAPQALPGLASVPAPPVASVPMMFQTAPQKPPVALGPGEVETPEVDTAATESPALQDAITNVLAQVLQEDATVSDEGPAPDPAELANDASDTEPEDSYASDGSDGINLAGLTVRGLNTPSVVFDWLAHGVAVLELHTPKGIILVTGINSSGGGSLPDLVFHRVGDLDQDPRSDLKVAAFEVKRLSKGLIESQLGMARGIYDIDRVDLTFTHHAVEQILQQQAHFLASPANAEAGLTPSDIHMTFCFEGRIAEVQSIVRSNDRKTLTEPRGCEA